MTREVANPDYTELVELVAEARRAAARHGCVLDRAARLIGSAQVWTGPTTATGFATEVEGRRVVLPGRFEEFIEEIEHRMTQTPRTVLVRTQVW